MKVFFDMPFRCRVLEVAHAERIKHTWLFNQVLHEPMPADLLQASGNVLLMHPSIEVLDLLIAEILKRNTQATSYTLATADKDQISYRLLKHFHIIRAAGGIVYKPESQEVLLIKRRGRWDIPKGKTEGKESKSITAKREVEEECNVKVQCLDKITTTYHVLPMRSGQYRLKRTTWFTMRLLDDAHMAPQTEEDIEEVRWVRVNQAAALLRTSYPSVGYVFYAWLLGETAVNRLTE